MRQYSEEEIQRAQDNAKRVQSAQQNFWTPVIGLAFIGFGIYMYTELAGIEQNGGTMKIHWLFYYAYKLGGKYLVSGIIIALGALMTFFGVKSLMKKKDA